MKKIKLILQTQNTKILNLINDLHWKELNKKLSFFPANYQFTPAFNKGKWDGRINLMRGNIFPTGLASRAIEYLKGAGYKIEIEDQRIKPLGKVEYNWVFPHSLRDYQENAVKEFIKAGRGCVVIPTAGGKSAIAMRIIYELKLPFLYLVHTKEARESAREDMVKCLGIEPDTDKLSDKAMVTIQSIVNPRAKLAKEIIDKKYSVLIIDELHRTASDKYYKVLMNIPSYYRFGMTATHERGDGAYLRLLAITGKVLYREKPKTLVNRGFLAKPIIRWIDYETKEMSPYDDYRTAYRLGIIECEERNIKIIEAALFLLKQNKIILIIVENIRHGKLLEKLFSSAGIFVPFINGTMSNKKRKKSHEDFLHGKIRCAIATKIYDESINLPKLNSIIMGAGGESSIRAQQRIGRELRISEGKNTAEYFDFKDLSHRILESHYYNRRRILEKIYGKN